MNTDDLRETFLSFFQQRGHDRCDSDSLVPTNDPTLLFTSAGMNQFKEQMLGGGTTAMNRATSCQKCFRTGDIEEVGKTPYHLTFFEMLGNFSFGDYFKEEAITWGWAFVREELGFPADRLCVSVYEGDDEAFRIWHEQVGVPEKDIYRFGEEENFWPASAPSDGPNGPCGPCSEIHYDYGEEAGCGQPDCDPACCDRFSELYNLVFMEFERQEGGEMEPLPQKNIDTGMGLERTAAILQDKPSVFQTDVLKPIVERAGKLLDTPYDPAGPRAPDLHRIADHVRASVFLISDGVLPSNEGRGYVERKLLRRAVDSGLEMGQSEPTLWQLVDPVVELMGDHYDTLRDAAENARNLIRNEEKTYLKTIDRGDDLLEQMMDELEESDDDTLAGDDAFLLYDTYGFPVSRTEEILSDHGFELDRKGFEEAMEEQRRQAREQTEIEGDVFGTGVTADVESELLSTNFIGYHELSTESELVVLIGEEGPLDEAAKGASVTLISRDTPFYAEAGGQVGDTGWIRTEEGRFRVDDTQSKDQLILHHGTVKSGRLQTGDVASFDVDQTRRERLATHHSCTHILNAILRDELGTHIQQAGSLVAPDHLRFDFSHPDALSEDQLRMIEERANEYILANHEVESEHTTLEDARERGALMFFGEKYGEIVRTVRIGDVSLELCGGTHLDRTRDASMFKIISESSVASGTRRIEAVCGASAIQKFVETRQRVDELCRLLSTTPEELTNRVQKLQSEISDLQKELKQARQMNQGDLLRDLEQRKESVGSVECVVREIDHAHQEQLRSLVDDLVKNRGLDAAFLAAGNGDSVKLALRISKRLREASDLNANDLIQRAAEKVGGGGGGRDDFAQAGGPDTDQVDEALKAVKQQLKKT